MPKQLKEVTKSDKSKLIRYFEKGKKVNDILFKFPQYNKYQLAAIKAHVTMATYD